MNMINCESCKIAYAPFCLFGGLCGECLLKKFNDLQEKSEHEAEEINNLLSASNYVQEKRRKEMIEIAESLLKLEELLRDIESNYNCDKDSKENHVHHQCRCCKALMALTEHKSAFALARKLKFLAQKPTKPSF